MSGLYYALDLATRTGFAKGRAGECPVSGSVLLKQTGEPRAVALGNLIAFLCAEWSADKPALVCSEAPLTLGAFLKIRSSEDNVRMHHGLHGVVEGLCARFGCELVEANNATVRKHFIGVARTGNRDETKAAVVRRCQLLKLMPADCHDNDRADAIALWDWATATYGKETPRELHLFDAGRMRRG